MPYRTLVRDLALTALCAAAWWFESSVRGLGSATEWTAASVAAALTGLAGFLLHEWGHLAATRYAGGHVHYPDRLLAPLLFHFDCTRNDRRQFLWMSAGGYAASLLGVGLIALLVPLHARSGQLALGVGVLGLVATIVGEVPTTLRVARGAPLPRGYAFAPPPRSS